MDYKEEKKMVDFLVIGPYLSVSNQNMFSLIKNRNICLGYNNVNDFDNNNKSVVCRWFSNMREDYPPELLLKEYKEGDYSKYDHFDAINIDRINDIPDYEGVMGVPVSFLDVWNPGQFELVYASDYIDDVLFSNRSCMLLNCNGGEAAAVDGKKKFHRILIKKKI